MDVCPAGLSVLQSRGTKVSPSRTKQVSGGNRHEDVELPSGSDEDG